MAPKRKAAATTATKTEKMTKKTKAKAATTPSADLESTASSAAVAAAPVSSRRVTAVAAIAAAIDTGLGAVPVLVSIIADYFLTRSNFVLRLGGTYRGMGVYEVECFNPETDTEWQVITSLDTKALRLGIPQAADMSGPEAKSTRGGNAKAKSKADEEADRVPGIVSAFEFDRDSKLGVFAMRPGPAGKNRFPHAVTECGFVGLEEPKSGGSGALAVKWQYDATLLPNFPRGESFGEGTLTRVIKDTVWVFPGGQFQSRYYSLPLNATGANRKWTAYKSEELNGLDVVRDVNTEFAAVYNDRVFFAGGSVFDPSERVVTFTPETLTFSVPPPATMPHLPVQVANQGLCAYDDGRGAGIAVSGGMSRTILDPKTGKARGPRQFGSFNEGGGVCSQVWYAVFDDPQQRGWMALPNMIRCRHEHSMIAVGTDLYVVGGYQFDPTEDDKAKERSEAAYKAGSGGAQDMSTVEHYSGKTKTWRQIPSANAKPRFRSQLMLIQSAE